MLSKLVEKVVNGLIKIAAKPFQGLNAIVKVQAHACHFLSLLKKQRLRDRNKANFDLNGITDWDSIGPEHAED